MGARQLRFDDLEDNLGISAFSTNPPAEGELRLFLELSNWSEEEKTARVEIAVNDLPVLVTGVSMDRLGRGRATLPIDAGPGDVVRATIVRGDQRKPTRRSGCAHGSGPAGHHRGPHR